MKRLLLSAILPLSLLSGQDPATRAFDPVNDNPRDLAPRERVERNFDRIAIYRAGSLTEIPWSDRAWDHNRALMNERYTDGDFVKLPSWPSRREYAEKYSAGKILAMAPGRAKDKAIASLSPAEKYDLVMGTIHNGLADANRNSLDHDMDSRGKFPTWWGICEGSAAASLVSPEPVSIVSVHSVPYGVDVPFYAPDVKSLVSLLWSSYNQRLKIPEIGRQCDDKGGGSCFDVNPSSFQAALHHFVGLGKGYLVADIDSTRVVWNHPIHGYVTQFFRIDRGADVIERDYRDAILPVERFKDPGRKARAPGTAFVVGAVTDMYYGENLKQHPLEGSVKRKVSSMRLVYELELDRNMEMIGGEWISKKHPDVLWTIPSGTEPWTEGDLLLGSAEWDGYSTPEGWETAAQRSAAGFMPLKKVVDALVRRSAR